MVAMGQATKEDALTTPNRDNCDLRYRTVVKSEKSKPYFVDLNFTNQPRLRRSPTQGSPSEYFMARAILKGILDPQKLAKAIQTSRKS